MRRTAGFTLLEVVLSLALAALVVSGVFSLLMLMQQNAKQSEALLRESLGQFRAQMAIRRAFQTMVAGKPTAPGDTDPESDDTAQADPAMADIRASLEAVFGAEDAASILRGDAVPEEEVLPHFQLWWENDPNGWLPPGALEPVPLLLPYVEVVVLESPVPIDTHEMGQAEREMTLRDTAAESFRGIFEVVPDELDPEVWTIQWTPIDPPLRPATLIKGVIPDSVAWSVLPLKRDQEAKDPWVDNMASYLAEDFPMVVRLVFRTQGGAQVDWMFEVAVAEVSGT